MEWIFIDYINYIDKAKRGGGNSSRTGKVNILGNIPLLHATWKLCLSILNIEPIHTCICYASTFIESWAIVNQIPERSTIRLNVILYPLQKSCFTFFWRGRGLESPCPFVPLFDHPFLSVYLSCISLFHVWCVTFERRHIRVSVMNLVAY